MDTVTSAAAQVLAHALAFQVAVSDGVTNTMAHIGENLGQAWLDDFYAASAATWNAGLLWWKVITPLAYTGATYLYDNPDLAAVVLLVVFLWLLRRFVKRQRYLRRISAWGKAVSDGVFARYQRFRDQVEKRSKRAAVFLPHLVFVTVLAAVLVWFPGVLQYANGTKPLFIFGIIFPLIMTELSINVQDANTQERQRAWLCYWAVIAFCLAIQHVPLLETTLSLLPHWSAFKLVWILWLQMPVGQGAQLLCHLLDPISARVEARAANHAGVERGRGVVNMLLSLPLLTDRMRRGLQIAVESGYVLLVSLPFVLTPGFVTHYGCQLVGLVFPASSSVAAVAAGDAAAKQRWLTYWTVFTAVTAAHELAEVFFGSLPFWYHAELAYTLWLQLPYFNGAAWLHEVVVGHWSVHGILMSPGRGRFESARRVFQRTPRRPAAETALATPSSEEEPAVVAPAPASQTMDDATRRAAPADAKKDD